MTIFYNWDPLNFIIENLTKSNFVLVIITKCVKTSNGFNCKAIKETNQESKRLKLNSIDIWI